jgi:hypothetical protein
MVFLSGRPGGSVLRDHAAPTWPQTTDPGISRAPGSRREPSLASCERGSGGSRTSVRSPSIREPSPVPEGVAWSANRDWSWGWRGLVDTRLCTPRASGRESQSRRPSGLRPEVPPIWLNLVSFQAELGPAPPAPAGWVAGVNLGGPGAARPGAGASRVGQSARRRAARGAGRGRAPPRRRAVRGQLVSRRRAGAQAGGRQA